MSDVAQNRAESYRRYGLEAEQDNKDELTDLKEENDQLIEQFEAVMARANALEVEAEIARLEFIQVFNAIDDAIWVIDNDKYVLRVNSSFEKLLSLEGKTDTVGKKCHELIKSDLCLTEKCPLALMQKEHQRLELDVEIENAKGDKVPSWLTITPLFGIANETIGIVEQYKDISKRKHYEEALEKANYELKRLATVDGLTQLANRRLFDETLRNEWLRMRRERQPLSLILCDVDYFKLYNDHYGHQEGDACLKAIAGCMKHCIQRSSDLVARYGGEEFVVILPNTDSDGARLVAEKMRIAILSMKREHLQSKVNDYVTLSFGVATVVPATGEFSPNDLVKKADDALYASKAASRNLVTAVYLGDP